MSLKDSRFDEVKLEGIGKVKRRGRLPWYKPPTHDQLSRYQEKAQRVFSGQDSWTREERDKILAAFILANG